MKTSTQVNSKSTCQEYDELQERTVNKILEVLGNPKYLHHVVQRRWDKIIVIRHEGAMKRMSFAFGTLGRGGLISVEDAIRVAKIVSDSDQPDPRAMRILTEYLEEEWVTFRLADVNREVAKYDAANPNGAYIPRCQSCGHQSNTAVCVPCRKALAMTLANLDVALALFVKEEVSTFRIGDTGVIISVGDAAYRMWQSGGVLSYENVKDLCVLAAVIPYDEGGLVAFGMMSNYLEAGAKKAAAIRDAARKDMMSSGKPEAVATVRGGAGGGGGGLEESGTTKEDMGIWNPTGEEAEVIEKIMDADMDRILKLGAKLAEEQKPSGFDAKTEEAIREAAEGKWCLSGVQGAAVATVRGGAGGGGGGGLSEGWTLRVGPTLLMGDPKLAQLAPVPSFDTGEASWPHCIDKEGNVSGDLLDTLYEFYERLREKCAADERPYPNVPRKNFFARLVRGNPEVVAIGVQDDRGRHALTAIPWDKPNRSSILAKLGEELMEAGDLGKSLSNVYATMLSIFQDMFAPKDDSALWGSSCG